MTPGPSVRHDLIADPAAFDLEAYFARIDYAGPRTATLEALREMHLRHAQSIAFENLNPLLRWPVRLDTASLVRKLVHERRGGYCFEQNLLFGHALHALGFRFRGLAARVVYNAPPGTLTARGHMLLAVELDEEVWLADVGFGVLTLTAPVAELPGVGQSTPHGSFRLTGGSPDYQLEARVRDTWTPLYRFTLETAYLPDYEMASWYLSHFPGSHFITSLIAARPFDGGRHALRNNVLTTHRHSGASERRTLTSGNALRAVLEEELQLRLPASPEIGALLDRIAALPVPPEQAAAAGSGGTRP